MSSLPPVTTGFSGSAADARAQICRSQRATCQTWLSNVASGSGGGKRRRTSGPAYGSGGGTSSVSVPSTAPPNRVHLLTTVGASVPHAAEPSQLSRQSLPGGPSAQACLQTSHAGSWKHTAPSSAATGRDAAAVRAAVGRHNPCDASDVEAGTRAAGGDDVGRDRVEEQRRAVRARGLHQTEALRRPRAADRPRAGAVVNRSGPTCAPSREPKSGLPLRQKSRVPS